MPDESLQGRYWLTRFVFLRFLGLIYFVAFLVLAHQARPLIGADGLYPAELYLERTLQGASSRWEAFLDLPTIFWLGCSDTFMQAAADAGVVLSTLLLLGLANVPLLATLWALYLSFVHIGQLFYGYGWEILLLETGFLAIFLVPPLNPLPFSAKTPPLAPMLWLLRWVLFRIMLGAGLIKLRGDACWRDLTCMMFHYETQPLPNPLSWYLHHLPPLIHQGEVLFNHFVEIVVPWLLFTPRRVRVWGAFFLALFQVLLILSGNLVWLNWLTLTLCIACFDDRTFAPLFSRRIRTRVASLPMIPSWGRRVVTTALLGLVAYLSINPILNLLSSRQAMNTSFDRLHIVNTYGAFGSIGRTRPEIILEGTIDDTITDTTEWREYEFKCKPGDVERRPCVVAPYHYRLDWQIWFAAMSDYQHNPWLVHLVYKLLQDDSDAIDLFAANPFPDQPPRFIRAELYRYEMTDRGEGSAWWRRTRIGEYLPPLSRDNPQLLRYLRRHGWEG